MSSENIINESAALRGLGRFDDAIELIEENIESIDTDAKVVAYLEAFKAAKEKGDLSLTKKYALLVASEDPNVPSIQDFL